MTSKRECCSCFKLTSTRGAIAVLLMHRRTRVVRAGNFGDTSCLGSIGMQDCGVAMIFKCSIGMFKHLPWQI